MLLAAVGSRGDVQPLLALGLALRARGHEPTLAAPPDFERWVRSHGLPFEALGTDMQAWLAQNPDALTGNPLRMVPHIRRFFGDMVPAQFERLPQLAAGASAIVFGGLAIAAPSVATALGIPALGVAYSPCVIPGRSHPPATSPHQRLPRWVNALLWGLSNVSSGWVLGRLLNEQRAKLGLPPVDLATHFFDESSLVVAADAGVLPPCPSWRGRYPYVGFLHHDDGAALDPDLLHWLDAGEPPVYVGMGSMTGRATRRLDSLLVDAFAGTGRRVLVGAGWGGLGDGALPSGWRRVGEAPHARLFPRMAAVVHHGGSGTTASALRAGVPQVVLPLILDQFHHAWRLHQAGLAPRPVPMERISADQLRDAVAAALALDPRLRRDVAQRLKSTDAAADLVQRIESMARPPAAAAAAAHRDAVSLFRTS